MGAFDVYKSGKHYHHPARHSRPTESTKGTQKKNQNYGVIKLPHYRYTLNNHTRMRIDHIFKYTMDNVYYEIYGKIIITL